MLKVSHAVSVMLLWVACSTASIKVATPGEPFRLKMGEDVRVGDMRVRFERVVSDSRCPADVTCIWEGNASVVLALYERRQSVSYRELNTSNTPGLSSKAPMGGFVITLSGLEPPPVSTQQVDERQYVATFLVDPVASE